MSNNSQNQASENKPSQGNNFSNTTSNANEGSNGIQIPQISLPKGGGAIKGIEEKFQVNAVSGTSSFGIPLPLSPARLSPSIGLGYSSGGGNSPFGLGWQLGIPSITRKTDKNLPKYQDEIESDTFILSGAEDLVRVLEKQGDIWKKTTKQRIEEGINYTIFAYRPRIEGLFARIERWQNDATGISHWRTISKDNVHSYYGFTPESRISDPKDSKKIFEWLLCKTHDDKGSICVYQYKKEDFVGIENKLNEQYRRNNCTQTYLKTVFYGNKKPYYLGENLPQENEIDYMFKVVFDYGEHDISENIPKNIDQANEEWTCRKDPFSTYRSGFEIRTYRRCSRVLVFHCFDELNHSPYLTKSLQLFYDDNLTLVSTNRKIDGFSFLVNARQNGHLWNSATNTYKTKFLPEIEIKYQQHEWNTEIKSVTPDNLANLPVGLGDKRYLWIDLFNEGISGILTEQAGAWYYKTNLGNAKFSNAQPVASTPSFSGLGKNLAIQEIEGNGIKYLVQLDNEPKGFFKFSEEDSWESMRTFDTLPNIEGTNMRALDLNADGKADLLISNENSFQLYEGLGEKGFKIGQKVFKEIDEEKGPAILFEDREQCIFLADMSGDGLTDIVRIRNGEICYWANLGYGKFGAKVGMDNAPHFDFSDTFNPAYLRLADIDGSGTTDIIYLGKNDFSVWMNLNGNEWTTEPQIINPFPAIHNLSDVSVLDFLGSGTASIVYSSPIATEPLQYIDLMGSKKPHVFNGYQNNCGKEVSIEYKPSTFFYLKDKKVGKKWITKLPFVVHCISKVRSEDKIRKTVFTSSYSYSHGYFDFVEREFRGFAKVEQFDTEDFENFKLNDAKNVVEEQFHQPPVRSVSWFHTGAFLGGKRILHQCQEEYFKNTNFAEYNLPEPILPAGLSTDEMREALRACKGLPLRSEVYANDNTDKSHLPYSASQSAFEIRIIQPQGENRFASFLVVPSESISYGYDRNPADPHISQSFILETDELGNSTKSTSVVYPRLARISGVPDKVWQEQTQMHISYGEALFTKDIDTDSIYRLRAGYESKSFEIAGINLPVDFFFKKENLKTQIATANQILFEEEFTNGVQKRLLAHQRAYFMNDGFSGSRPLGELSPLGIGFKSLQLAFTKNLVTKYYAAKVTNQMLLDAKYIHSENDERTGVDEHWWIPSGDYIFANDPKSNFYTPIGAKDLYGNEGFVEFDKYTLLTKSTTDAIGNKATAINDYRTLSPILMTDPNLNRAAVETDELGMVIKSTIMGKLGSNDGDTLADPTARLEYDLFNWQNNGKPNFVHTFAREKHGAANPRWQESFAYSDGGGGVIMGKSQVNAGKAKRWNTQTKVVEEVETNPRWIGNGRTIVNNKGKAIKQFEPYFSTTFEYESEDALVETGISPIMFYDAIGRNIRTEMPNGTFTKVEFDAWYFKSFDVNDTVIDSQWYADRGSPDPNLPEPNNPEQRAAWLAAKHYNTPGTVHTDSLGRTFYAISNYGNGKTSVVFSENDATGRFSKAFDQLGRMVSEGYVNLLGQTMYGKSAEKGENWVFVDAMGRLVKIWDNNLREFRTSFDTLHRPVSSYMKEGANETLFGRIVYGDIIPNAETQNLRGVAFQMYDQAGVITVKNIDFKGNPNEVERRLTKEYKQVIDWKVLEGINDFATIQALANPFLETEIFTSKATLDALGRPLTVILPDNSVVRPTYNEGNGLESLDVQIRGNGAFVNFLESQDYDAKGQRQFAKFGNGTITKYFYDPQTFRLINLVTTPNAGANANQAFQNLKYTFDPTGNITQIRDDAQQTHYFRNAVVFPESKFEYDALYQLTQATGREHAGLGGNVQRSDQDIPFINQLPHQNNADAVRIYTENYEYDLLGNIKRLQHRADGANWNQRYQYAYEIDPNNRTNQLKATSISGDAAGVFSNNYTYDFHGNMTQMPHLSKLDWNFMDQLNEVNLGGGGKAFYTYGTGGNRMRKVIERIGGKRLERIYLGAVEIYRERQGNNAPNFERYTLSISDNTGKIAQVDTKTIDSNNSDNFNLLNQNSIRYQYGNHLGSAALETDEIGQVISYEEYHPYGTSAYRVAKPDKDISLKRYRFSGKERDEETGLYYFGARYYAAWLGRWTSSDPAGFVDGFNLYRYCSNNPVMFHDPDGTNGITVGGKPEEVRRAQLDPSQESGQIYETWIRGQVIESNGVNYRVAGGQLAWGTFGGGSTEHWYIANNTLEQVPDTAAASEAPPEAPAPVTPPGAGATGLGTQAVTANPEGFTLEVPDNFDADKISAYRQRITTDRGVGNRSAVPGERSRPSGSDVTDGIRRRTQPLFDSAEATHFPNGRPAGQQLDHTVELQHIIRGNSTTSGADTIRPQDFRPLNGSLNGSQGSRARAVRTQSVAAGAPQDAPAGGVARSSDMGRFGNSEGFRTGMRNLGFGMMWAGPFMTAYGAYHSDSSIVRYGGGAVSVTEFGAAGYYTYGRFAMGGGTGASGGVAAMSMASRIGMGAGGVGAVLFNGYQAYQDFSQGNVGWGVVNTIGAVAGGVMIAAALGFTAPVWGTAAAIVVGVVAIAGFARWLFS